MKILKVIGWIMVGIVALIAVYIAFVAISWSGVFLPAPRMPEIEYAEFPFRIEIEYNGERLVFEDAIVCEYAGVGVSGYGTSKHRRWKEQFVSGNEYQSSYPSTVLLDTDDVLIRYIAGEGAYYMDTPYYEIDDRGTFDKDNDGTPYTPWSPTIYVNSKIMNVYDEQSSWYFHMPSQEDQVRKVLANHGIEIISIEQTPPIENTFR